MRFPMCMRVDASMGTCTRLASVNTPAAPFYVERPGVMVTKVVYVKTVLAGIRAYSCAPMHPYADRRVCRSISITSFAGGTENLHLCGVCVLTGVCAPMFNLKLYEL